MRLKTKSIITLVAMLLSGITEAWGAVTVIIQQNGTQVTVSSDGNGGMTSSAGTIKVLEPAQDGTVKLTATPATGFYITAEQISVTRTVDGSKAQTREPSIDNTPLTLTALTPNDDPSGETSYSFTMDMAETAEYDYEITANFLSQTDLSNATITLEETTFAWDGQPKEPAVTSVKVGETVIDPSNYTVSWHENIEPGAATDQKAPFANVTGKFLCTGYAIKTFTITKATPTLKFSKETATATMGAEFEAPTLTVTPEGLEGVKYTSSNANVATVNETTGAVTLVGAGEAVIKASFAGDDHYETAEGSYTLTVSKVTTTLKFAEETATAIMGAEFEAPTLTVTPEGLQGVKYSSSNTNVATVNETTGAVTLVGAGEAVIKASFAGTTVYEAAEASYTLTVSEATPQTETVTLTFSEKTVSATLGEEFEAPTLTIEPEGLQGVKYTSSNTDVATVNETTGAVTLVAAGETTIKASFAGNDNYEAAEASYTLTVSEATPQTVTVTLTFSEKTVSATLGAEFQTPTLTVTPEGLEGVKYTSSNTDVATVNETTGAVTLVAAGETTITAKFAGNDNYEAAEASYTLTVNRAQSEGYGLWINDIQVTEDNYFDVLGNSTDSKSGTIVFNPEKNTLVMTNDVSNVEIESRLESLTLHINDVNKVKSIRFNNLDDATKTGKLAITTNGNFPGQIIITNDAGVSAISGFSEITLNMGLQYLEPELVEIENGELYKYDWDNTNSDNPVKKLDTKAVCDAVTIGVVITPLTRNVTVSMANASDYTAKDENGNTVLDENGNPKTVSMMNFAQNKDILLTLWTKNDEDNYQKGNDGDWPDAGFDSSDGDPGITMVITMTDAQALAVAASVLANTIQPGGTTYSMEFKGATFIVPAGSGEIDVWVKTDPGYVYKLLPVGLSEETHKLDFNSPSIKEYQDLGNGKIKVTVEYNDLPTQTYYMLYLAEEAPSGARGGTRLGKRDKAHGKLYSVGVRPRSITDVNPPSEASGGVIDEEEDPEGVIDNPTPPTPPTGIQTVASESSANSNKWFTADGRQLEGKPTKPGFYIRNGKKVVIK